MYPRYLHLPKKKDKSFFLWGPRQVGKTALLKKTYPDALFIQLLKSEEFAAFQADPTLLRQRLRRDKARFLIIDEIQKVPQLLDEVHFLIEEEGIAFGLCGSSARKVRAQHANLLGGRALRFELFGMVASELGDRFDLTRMLNHGYLPAIYDSDDPVSMLRAYCADYLKEEIFAEGLVRKLQPFSRFLELAALSDTEIVSFEAFARDCGVSSPTARSYFDILNDTLMARYLPPYLARPKRRQIVRPKFYFSDVGVVNYLAQRGTLAPRSELFGKAFENWVCHELSAYLSYRGRVEKLSYWRLTTGVEVDFIIGHTVAAIEAKASSKIHADHVKGLRELQADYPAAKKRFVVSLEPQSRENDDGIVVLSVPDIVKDLFGDKLFRGLSFPSLA
jgi:predicted AAA+ superfamily ATPase